MLTVTYRTHGIRLSHVWFATKEEVSSGRYKEKTGDLIFLHCTDLETMGGTLYTTQHTLLKYLSLSKEQLLH